MLDIVWVGFIKDANSQVQLLWQYNDKGEEVLFKDILAKQDSLVGFGLVNKSAGFTYYVDLLRGVIATSSEGVPFIEPREDMLRKDEHKYRLIYFREVTRSFDSNLKELDSPEIIYFVGFQYTDKEGKNHKRIMKIENNGRTVVN
jgi:hypothetical protein